jgi:hypothetical protein
MKLKSALVVTVVTCTGLNACSVALDKPSKKTAVEAVVKLRYIKDPITDLCFALVSTSHALTVSDDGMTITWVPCDQKVLEQIGK